MESVDTGKVRVAPQGDLYLEFSFYEGGEVGISDAIIIRDYLDQFNGQVPILIQREARYSLATEVQLLLMREARSRFSAAAYIDRSHQDFVLTNLAKDTYMKDVPVKSFQALLDAKVWLSEYGPILGGK